MKIKIFLIILISCLLASPVYSINVNEDISTSIDSELSNFFDSLPDDVANLFPNDLFNQEIINEKSIIDYITSYIFSGFNTIISSFTSIFLLLIVSALLTSICHCFSNSALNKIFSLCSILCVSITVFNICIGLCKLVSAYNKTLCRVISAFIPLMSALGIMGGAISSTATISTACTIMISIVDSFLILTLLPLVKGCLTLAVAKPIGGNDLSGISKTLKNIFTSAIVFIMSILMFILTSKNVLAQGNDSITIKTARFAISSFVPIVGASVNDALRTVSASLVTIKNACGIIAIIAIAMLMLPLIIHLLLYKLSFGLLSSISKAINCENEGDILSEADSLCSFMLTLVTCSCVLFVFAITLFINVYVGVG